jgi:Calcineurin-like phosphoesterase superfamily domain
MWHREQPDICIFGHTHQAKIEWFGKTLLFKPGSVDTQRFNLLRVGRILEVIDGKSKPVRIQQFENVVDNRVLGLGEEIWFRKRGFRNAGTGILAAKPFVM